MEFVKLKAAMSRQFERMSRHDLLVTRVDKDALWETYLGAFPAGSNPRFRERTEHDCGCCRQFVRTVGSVAAIIDDRLESIWDTVVGDQAYQAVVDAMSTLVKSQPIDAPFIHYERSVGTDKNYEDDAGTVRTWEHFCVQLPRGSNSRVDCVRPKSQIPTLLGEARSVRDVFLRSLTELTAESAETVLDLIAQNSLYRGREHQATVEKFLSLRREFEAIKTDSNRDVFIWSRLSSTPPSVTRVRNTAIGTLLIDLSASVELEDAVRKFEAVMAPANYKRPTALVTKKMVDAARTKVEELGLASALDRRFARLTDISASNVIFADRNARSALRTDIFDDVAVRATTPKSLSKVESIPIDKFIADVVPRADSIEAFLENRHVSNLVSLVAPTDPSAAPLLKWSSGISWSYGGDATDSVRERVKRAGGSVTGDLCCRLAWSNHDDLDLHMREPRSHEISYINKRSPMTGGRLDVDMNAGCGTTREPVENIFYGDRCKMTEGIYNLFVHQFSKRESVDVGFEVEMEYLGGVTRYAYEKVVPQGATVEVAKFKYAHVTGVEILKSLPPSTLSRRVWGLDTQQFHRVSVITVSPNHWDGQEIGNRHYFLMLDGCVRDGQARGFYNEFLRPELDKYRKVLELVGSRTMTEEALDQLSGVGFSDTKRDEMVVRVKGSFTRTLRVQF